MVATVKAFLQQVFHDFSQDECTSMAAALAYALIFSLPSLLLIVIFIAGLVLGPQAASGNIQAKLSTMMGTQAAAEVQTMVDNLARNRVGGLVATLAGIAGLVLSATGVLLQLQHCLNRAWKVAPIGSGLKHFARQRLRSGLLLIGAGILVIASIAASSIITALARYIPFEFAVHTGELLTSLLTFTVVFGGILKVMPDVKLDWRDVWVGGLFIALLFLLGKYFISFYLAHAGRSSIYGAAGSLALILLWTYYSALILLLGVEFTQVWVRSRGREIVPKDGAVRFERRQPGPVAVNPAAQA